MGECGMMYWDRFDIVEAHYLFCRDWHGGQWSDLYARMCRISKYFTPGLYLEYESLTENGQAIYDKLVVDLVVFKIPRG